MDKTTGVRVLFTGQYWSGANSMYIARAFERCGAVVRILNETGIFPSWESRLSRGVRRLLQPLIEIEFNRQLLHLASTFMPDLIYITNSDYCWLSTVRELKRRGFPVMCFYHDVKWMNRSGTNFSKNIAEFDMVATTRRWHEPEFRMAGAKAVFVVRFGFDPQVHRPIQPSAHAIEFYGSDSVFIGTYENQRSSDLNQLLYDLSNYRLQIWGNLWNTLPAGAPARQHWRGRAVLEQEIPVIYATNKIALHWVGWEPNGIDQAMKNGDQHNSRTFQIAACGGAIMLAQRTDEHRLFFEEDKEALFFNDVDELKYKLKEWLDPKRDADRQQMAEAARMRCIKENYTYDPVVDSFLHHFNLPSTLGK